MFRVSIMGEIDGKSIKVFLGRRYKIYTSNNVFEGTITECKNESFLIKTVEGGFVIDFELISDIKEM